MTLSFAVPQNLSGEQLADELETAGYQEIEVSVSGDELRILGQTESGNDITEQSRSKIQGVIDAHVPDPDHGKDPKEEADEDIIEAFLTKTAPTAAETIDALKALIRCR